MTHSGRVPAYIKQYICLSDLPGFTDHIGNVAATQHRIRSRALVREESRGV
ncbi:MAG: hypothetical protein WAW07_16090 [Bacteroidales bacterium]